MAKVKCRISTFITVTSTQLLLSDRGNNDLHWLQSGLGNSFRRRSRAAETARVTGGADSEPLAQVADGHCDSTNSNNHRSSPGILRRLSPPARVKCYAQIDISHGRDAPAHCYRYKITTLTFATTRTDKRFNFNRSSVTDGLSFPHPMGVIVNAVRYRRDLDIDTAASR
ncbi:hypothetical protein EVAR_64573_1 [Eumeta japonica]|uniref:Uncharacterized protein n=1 Tax=Eumeta variegata TaxID=151549 RepID=A0A4C1ZDX1_EUMVA|nr:hypothetical protein EVAR_64573_1 [Eumeta japonica]